MNNKEGLSFKLELVWWVFTIILIIGILFPIVSKIDNYPFLITNILYIVIFVTFTRYIFLLKHTFLSHRQVLKPILIILSIPLFFYLVSELNYFQTYLDEKGIDSFLGEISYENRPRIASFIRNEMILFGVGSIITTVLFPLRMILSLWRWKNRDTV